MIVGDPHLETTNSEPPPPLVKGRMSRGGGVRYGLCTVDLSAPR
jgi:hypothetical protein